MRQSNRRRSVAMALLVCVSLVGLAVAFQPAVAQETPTPETPEETPEETPAQAENASIEFENQTLNGSTLNISSATLSDGGFIAVYTIEGDFLGNSSYLSEGPAENVTVTLTREVNVSGEAGIEPTEETPAEEETTTTEETPAVAIQETETATEAETPAEDETAVETTTVTVEEEGEEPQQVFLVAVAHRDTNGNQEFDFMTSERMDDRRYVNQGSVVIDDAVVAIDNQVLPNETENVTTTTAPGTATDVGTETETDENETAAPETP